MADRKRVIDPLAQKFENMKDDPVFMNARAIETAANFGHFLKTIGAPNRVNVRMAQVLWELESWRVQLVKRYGDSDDKLAS